MMEAKTIQERIRMAGRQRLPWDSSMSIDDMERACAVIDAVAAEFDNDLAYNPATHIVVSREAAGQSRWALNKLGLESYAGNADAEAELRAAMEGRSE